MLRHLQACEDSLDMEMTKNAGDLSAILSDVPGIAASRKR